jgi:hypothetical protein
MLLRSVTKHITEQNWFGVLVDFLIVVVGILIAFQVTNWNEALVIDQESKKFTLRLKENLKSEAWTHQFVTEYYSDVIQNAQIAADALEGKITLDNKALLIAAYRATQYTTAPRFRDTYDELVSTGRIALIRDDQLRIFAARVYSFSGYEDMLLHSANSIFRQAFRMNIPVFVQQALVQTCGDRDVRILDYNSIVKSLNYSCTLNISQDEAKNAVNILRENKDILPALRLRLIDLESGFSTIAGTGNVDVRDGLLKIAKENR